MFLTAITFFIILGILVVFHELGHFLVARFFGVRVEEFGFGLPPRIFGKKIHHTIYSLNWLPIGGFVRLAGEDDDTKQKAHGYAKKEYFWAKTKKQRIAILLAGVTMNFSLAVIITTVLLTQGVYKPSGHVSIVSIVAGSPAAKAGIMKGDIIVRADTKDMKGNNDLVTYVGDHKGKPVVLTVERKGAVFPITIVPRVTYPKEEGPTGITISDIELKKYPVYQAPFEAVKLNLTRAWEMITGIGTLFVRLVQLKPVGDDVAGPIGIAQVTGQAVRFGFKAVLEFMAILSLNLAVLNILPIPALDGGRVLFVFLEKLLGKRLRPAFERSTHQIGMLVLLILVALISVNDILRLARGG